MLSSTLLLLLLAGSAAAQEVAQPVPCLRWAHQSTVARDEGGDGLSLWIYGGRARTALGQALNSELGSHGVSIPRSCHA